MARFAEMRMAVVCVVVCVLWGVTSGSPAGYETRALRGVSALAYGADGTLYLVESGSSTLLWTAADGAQGAVAVVGATLVSVGGMAVTPEGTLLITDNKGFFDGQGELYEVHLTTGKATVLLAGMDLIDDVAVRSTGEVFVSDPVGTDASGSGLGGIWQVARDGSGIVGGAPVVAGLHYASGLDFDPDGKLIYQQANALFAGEVYRLPMAIDGGGGLSFGVEQLLAGGLSAGADLAVDGDGDVFVTGAGGLFELDRDGAGGFTGTATNLESHGFSMEVAFAAGSDPFEPYGGYDGGHLTFVPSYNSPSLVDVSPTPEPSCAALLAAGVLTVLRRGRRKRDG